MLIAKFGGTSVGKPERLKKIAGMVMGMPGKKIVVLSALSGTTNTLVKIGELTLTGKLADAALEIDSLEAHYVNYTDELFSVASFKKSGSGFVSEFFKNLRTLVGGEFSDKQYRELLAQGELASTAFFHQYLCEQKIDARLVPALDFMSIDENLEPELEKISGKLNKILPTFGDSLILITQGYICRNAQGEIDNLKRGGSDYTASLIGAAIRAEEIQIWTDIDGMHNNDPRVVKKTMPIAELTFDEASELAYFGAKILHPSTIVPAQKFGVPVRLKNTMDEKAAGTLISNKGTSGQFKAIAAKDGILAINVKSSRMLLAFGFLRRVFEIFEKYKTSIDMISTSEVAVSVTIDDAARLDEIIRDLQQFGTIEVDRNQTIICIVGNKITEKHDALSDVFSSLAEIPVRMVSYGGSHNNISILVDTSQKEKCLNLLNKGLFDL